jgi:hypothetical protein
MSIRLDDSYIYNELKEFFKKIKEHNCAYLFLQPIEEVISSIPHYTDVIKYPIDLNKIETKLLAHQYYSLDDFKNDIELMFNNCKTFNNDKKHWCYRTCVAVEDFFNSNWKKLVQKIQKYQEKAATTQPRHKGGDVRGSSNMNIDTTSNIQVISNTEDEKITKRIKNLFMKISPSLNATEEQIEEIIQLIVKNIVKRNKQMEQIYDDTVKFLTKNLKNDSLKSHFLKKFRKLLRTIKEEQTENANLKNEKAFAIKIDLNEDEEKREEKDRLEQIKKECINFIDNQKIPEEFRDIHKYPIDAKLREKISLHIRNARISTENEFMQNK